MKSTRIIGTLVVIVMLLIMSAYLGPDHSEDVDTEIYQISLLGFSCQSLDQVHRFRLEVRQDNGDRIGMGFHDEERDDEDVAVVVRRTGEIVERISGEKAETEIDQLVRKLPHPTKAKPLDLVQETLEHLGIEQRNVREIELGIHLTSGQGIRMDLDINIDDAEE